MSGDPVREALATELVTAMVGRGTLDIAGFGAFAARRYKAFEGRDPRSGLIVKRSAKVEVSFIAAPVLRERIYEGTSAALSIECPDIVAAAAARVGETAEAVARALGAWLEDIIVSSATHSHGRPLGASGIIAIATKAAHSVRNPQTLANIEVPARRFVRYIASRCVTVRLAGGTIGGFVDPQRVAEILARYPQDGITSTDQLGAIGERLGWRHDGSLATAVERARGAATPALLRACFGAPFPVEWFASRGDPQPDTVFAFNRRGGEWRLDATGEHVLGSDDVIALPAWVTACALVAELDAAAGDRVLGEVDATTVLDYLETAAPHAALADIIAELPY